MTWSQSHKRTRFLSEVSFSKYFLTITHKNYSDFQWCLCWETGNLDTLQKLGLWKERLSWKPQLLVLAASRFLVSLLMVGLALYQCHHGNCMSEVPDRQYFINISAVHGSDTNFQPISPRKKHFFKHVPPPPTIPTTSCSGRGFL